MCRHFHKQSESSRRNSIIWKKKRDKTKIYVIICNQSKWFQDLVRYDQINIWIYLFLYFHIARDPKPVLYIRLSFHTVVFPPYQKLKAILVHKYFVSENLSCVKNVIYRKPFFLVCLFFPFSHFLRGGGCLYVTYINFKINHNQCCNNERQNATPKQFPSLFWIARAIIVCIFFQGLIVYV